MKISKTPAFYRRAFGSLESEIDVGPGINIRAGRFGKNNKRRVRNNSRGGKIFFSCKDECRSAEF